MGGEKSLSLPDRYYQSPGFVVRTEEEDAIVRRLMADVPAVETYRPPTIVTPGEELPSDIEDIWEGPVSVPLVHREAPTGQTEQATEAPASFRQRATRAIIEFFRGY